MTLVVLVDWLTELYCVLVLRVMQESRLHNLIQVIAVFSEGFSTPTSFNGRNLSHF